MWLPARRDEFGVFIERQRARCIPRFTHGGQVEDLGYAATMYTKRRISLILSVADEAKNFVSQHSTTVWSNTCEGYIKRGIWSRIWYSVDVVFTVVVRSTIEERREEHSPSRVGVDRHQLRYQSWIIALKGRRVYFGMTFVRLLYCLPNYCTWIWIIPNFSVFFSCEVMFFHP